MSAIAIVHGTIRQTRTKTKRETGEVFGTEVSVLTDAGRELGETLPVLVFNAREGERAPRIEQGLAVAWVVDLSANSFGLQARFMAELDADEVGKLVPNARQIGTLSAPKGSAAA